MSDFKNLADALSAFEQMPGDALMRPSQAGVYSKLRWGRGSERTLAKLRCLGGGPEFQKLGPSVVVYTKQAIDDWNRAKISAPLASTSHRAA